MKKLLILTFILALISLSATIALGYYYRQEIAERISSHFKSLPIENYYLPVDETITLDSPEKILTFILDDTDLEFIPDASLSSSLKITGHLKTHHQNFSLQPRAQQALVQELALSLMPENIPDLVALKGIVISTLDVADNTAVAHSAPFTWPFTYLPLLSKTNITTLDNRRSKLQVHLPADLEGWQVALRSLSSGNNQVWGELQASGVTVTADWGDFNLASLALNDATNQQLSTFKLILNAGAAQLPPLSAAEIDLTVNNGRLTGQSLTASKNITITNGDQPYSTDLNFTSLQAGEKITVNNGEHGVTKIQKITAPEIIIHGDGFLTEISELKGQTLFADSRQSFGNFTLSEVAAEQITLHNLSESCGGNITLTDASAAAIIVNNDTPCSGESIVITQSQGQFTLSNRSEGLISLQHVTFLPGSRIIEDQFNQIQVLESQGDLWQKTSPLQ